jgi:AP-1 complex subunit beta-1
VATLSEISANSPEVIADFTKKSFKTLLAALNECTEWGQIFILDSIANYEPADDREACMVADRVSPRLQHANSAVVLSRR